MCSPFVRKEANRFFWIVKGQLIPESEPDHIIEEYYNSYFKRIWIEGSNGAPISEYELGFEVAYKEREAKLLNRRNTR